MDLQTILPIIIILAIAAIGIPIWLKKRKGKNVTIAISKHKDKDEVWKAVKQYLKDSNDYGKEIVDCYVAKRNGIDYINPNAPKNIKMNKREEIKLRKTQFEQQRLAAKKNGKKLLPPRDKDLDVVCFTTKQTKTGIVGKPRAIECEVINTKVNKKEYDRKIIINGLLDYDKEMEWIAPIKFAETTKNAKAIKQQQKIEERQRKVLEKKKLKSKAKIEKAKQKANKVKSGG